MDLNSRYATRATQPPHNPAMSNDPSIVHYDEDEISLVDIIRFFQRQWRLIGGVTIAIAVTTVAISLTKPSSYERSITLQITAPFLLLGFLEQPTNTDALPQIAVVDTLGDWTSTALNELELDAGVQRPTYDTTANQLTFGLTASNPKQLEVIPTALVLEGLAEQWQVPLAQAITARTRQLEVQQQKTQQILSQLEAAIAQLPADNVSRQEALESQRASTLRQQADVTFQYEYLTELKNNIEQASQDLLPIEIAAEGDIQESRTALVQVTVLAVIAGFMVATLLAIIVEQWPHWQAELAVAQTAEASPSESNEA